MRTEPVQPHPASPKESLSVIWIVRSRNLGYRVRPTTAVLGLVLRADTDSVEVGRT
jgi:hypothetical protein